MNDANVPLEILAHILTFPSHKDWGECQVVCKRWQSATSEQAKENRKRDHAAIHLKKFNPARMMKPDSFSMVFGNSGSGKTILAGDLAHVFAASVPDPFVIKFATAFNMDDVFIGFKYQMVLDTKTPVNINDIMNVVGRNTGDTPLVVNDDAGFEGDVDKFANYLKSKGGGLVWSSSMPILMDNQSVDYMFLFRRIDSQWLPDDLWNVCGSLCFGSKERFERAMLKYTAHPKFPHRCLVLDNSNKSIPRAFWYEARLL